MSALGFTPNGDEVCIDLDRLIGSHACVVANSGGGKSGLIRRLLEVTHGRVQQIVLDVEDEFYTLRERFDFVIAGGADGDAAATPDNAGQLARAALEHGFSLVAQINDLGPDGAPAFVGRFLEAMISAPRELWRPVLVVVDEAQRFAPQDGSTAATAGIKALTAQGRKRGFTAVLASQRIAKIDADVRGDINNWMLGRVGQALDRRTVSDLLGFAPSSAEARGLQGMQDRTFWGFGPAVSREPKLFRVVDVETTPVRPGQAKVVTPPPPEAMRALLAGLASAPAAEGPAEPRADAEALRRAVERARADARAEGRREGYAEGLEHGRRMVDRVAADLDALAAQVRGIAAPVANVDPVEPEPHRPPETTAQRKIVPPATTADPGKVSPTARRILDVIHAAAPVALSFRAAAKRAGASAKSSAFRDFERQVRESGEVVEADDRLRSARTDIQALVSTGDPVETFCARLQPSYAAMLRVIAGASGKLSKDAIAEAARISPTSSGLGSGLRELVDLDLIERLPDGCYRLSPDLRPLHAAA